VTIDIEGWGLVLEVGWTFYFIQALNLGVWEYLDYSESSLEGDIIHRMCHSSVLHCLRKP